MFKGLSGLNQLFDDRLALFYARALLPRIVHALGCLLDVLIGAFHLVRHASSAVWGLCASVDTSWQGGVDALKEGEQLALLHAHVGSELRPEPLQ